MQQRQLGKTNIFVSEISLGCASYWGKHIFDEATAINIVHTAVENGINLFDTGHSYSDGNAEIRLGKALASLPQKADLVISTKAGTRISNNGKLFKDFSPQWIRKSCYQSLKQLNIESIGLFHLHGPSLPDFNDELLTELDKLKKDGYVRAIGINTFNDIILEKILTLDCFDFVMPDYNILSLDREPLIERFYNKKIGVIAGAALADSLFSNRIFKIKGVKDLWYLARALKNFRGKLVKGFSYRFVNNYHEYTGNQIAIAYILQNIQVASAIFGTTNKSHLLENISAHKITLSNDILDKIRAVDKE